MSCPFHGTLKVSRCTPFYVILTSATAANLYDIVTIDKLPDNVLLEVFEYYVNDIFWKDVWRTLVQVCRRWRRIVFGSPRLLNLRLVCTAKTPVEKMLNIWPDLPIAISVCYIDEASGVDNVIATLGHNDRVRELEVNLWGYDRLEVEEVVGKIASAMQKPFPLLTSLTLRWNEEAEPAFPDSFLGGCPRLKVLHSNGIPSPALQRLLLSATDLYSLCLGGVDRHYISPEEVVTCLSVLTRLEYLSFDLIYPRTPTDQESRHPHLPTRIVLPALRSLHFEELGDSEYLEDLVAKIDAPLLNTIEIEFTDEATPDTPQLAQLIRRSPKLKGFNEARLSFYDDSAEITLYIPSPSYRKICLGISSGQPTLQPSSLAWVRIPSLLPLPTLEDLYITENRFSCFWQDNENAWWLEVFRPFTAVKNLYLSKELVPCIVPVLQELIGERVTEVLPALQNIFLQDLQLSSGPVQEAVQQFVTARRFSGYPVTVSHWERNSRSWV